MKPRLLDLFSGAGGAAVGYARAGFEVVGVDLVSQPNYPFEFMHGDALAVLPAIHRFFDAIHASPPCQSYSRAMKHLSAPTELLVDKVRDLLEQTGLPWVIENVEGAPVARQDDLFGRYGTVLCGTAYGMKVYRHPSSVCCHREPAMNPHNQAGRDRISVEFGPGDQERPWREEMGVGWMTRYEAREAIPPAYTEHIGSYLMMELQARQKAAA